MTLFIKKSLIIVGIIITLIPNVTNRHAEAETSKDINILFVFSWHQNMPWQQEVEKGFENHLKTQKLKYNLFYEYIDAARFKSQLQVKIFKNYLTEKYQTYPIDYAIYESMPAAKLFQSCPELFKNARQIALDPEIDPYELSKISTVIPIHANYYKAVKQLITISRPKTIYVVAGATEGSKERAKNFIDITTSIDPRQYIVPLVGLPMNQLLDQVAKLESKSVIFYLLMFQDGDGIHYIPYNAATEISMHASVPVYSLWTSLMGSGIVGGYMISGELVGKEAASLLMSPDKLHNTVLENLTDKFHDHFFDWQQLKRWNIDIQSLPLNSEIMFKQLSFIEQYYIEIEIIILIMVMIGLFFRNLELKKYNKKINAAHKNLQITNNELTKIKAVLEEKNKLLEKISITDSLTGLFNRGYIDNIIHSEFNRLRRYQGELAIIISDIDHFKSVNDTYGHQIGDEVLITVSQTLKNNIRDTDTVGRWGGEEFMIVCPHADEKQSLIIAEKLRKIIERTQHDSINKTVTCSFGVASYVPGIDESQLIKNADMALYISKNAGRNCISPCTNRSTCVLE